MYNFQYKFFCLFVGIPPQHNFVTIWTKNLFAFQIVKLKLLAIYFQPLQMVLEIKFCPSFTEDMSLSTISFIKSFLVIKSYRACTLILSIQIWFCLFSAFQVIHVNLIFWNLLFERLLTKYTKTQFTLDYLLELY